MHTLKLLRYFQLIVWPHASLFPNVKHITSISIEVPAGTWCSGITPASHVGGPGFNPQCVQLHSPSCLQLQDAHVGATFVFRINCVASCLRISIFKIQLVFRDKCRRAHGVVVSHPLSMREALGSIPSVSMHHEAAAWSHGWFGCRSAELAAVGAVSSLGRYLGDH